MNVATHYQISGRGASEIAASIEAAVQSGRLGPGELLPPVRALAGLLGVSAGTVAAAFRLLALRGIVIGEGRRGTRVRPRPPLTTRTPAPPPGLRNLADGNPAARWLPSFAPFLARLAGEPRLYGESTDHPRLLEAARAQFAADGVDATRLAILGGALDGIERALQAHLRAGDVVAVEDPGYTGVLDLLRALGLQARGVPVDDHGPDPEGLELALARGARAFLLTPRAQNPTGAALDEDRAGELRGVLARHPRVLLIEDDHAALVAGVPAATLSAGRESWAVVRSASKALGPDLRVALVAGDETTIARVQGRQALGAGWVSHLLQGLVAELLTDAGVARTLAAAAADYGSRRVLLVDALARHGLAAHGRSGLNVWIPVAAEAPVAAHLAAHGWAVRPGEPYRLQSGPGLRVTVSTLEAGEAAALAAALAEAQGARGRTRGA